MLSLVVFFKFLAAARTRAEGYALYWEGDIKRRRSLQGFVDGQSSLILFSLFFSIPIIWTL